MNPATWKQESSAFRLPTRLQDGKRQCRTGTRKRWRSTSVTRIRARSRGSASALPPLFPEDKEEFKRKRRDRNHTNGFEQKCQTRARHASGNAELAIVFMTPEELEKLWGKKRKGAVHYAAPQRGQPTHPATKCDVFYLILS